MRGVISEAHVLGNDKISFYSCGCGRRNSLQEGFLSGLGVKINDCGKDADIQSLTERVDNEMPRIWQAAMMPVHHTTACTDTQSTHPVSYTHLAVYKRQSVLKAIFPSMVSAKIKLSCITEPVAARHV